MHDGMMAIIHPNQQGRWTLSSKFSSSGGGNHSNPLVPSKSSIQTGIKIIKTLRAEVALVRGSDLFLSWCLCYLFSLDPITISLITACRPRPCHVIALVHHSTGAPVLGGGITWASLF